MERRRPRGNVVEAPPSRYRVVERNGRLTVLDRGVAVQTDIRARAPAPMPGKMQASANREGAPGQFEMWARILADRFAERREADGRLLLRAPKGQTGGKRIWLTPGQARVYGWALLGVVGGAILLVPGNLLLTVIGLGMLSGLATFFGFIAAVAGWITLLGVRAAAMGARPPGR